MTWQTQDTRRQRQRTGGQSGRLRRIDSKGCPHPRWLSLRVRPCVGSRGLLASLRAHNIPAGEGRSKGAASANRPVVSRPDSQSGFRGG